MRILFAMFFLTVIFCCSMVVMAKEDTASVQQALRLLAQQDMKARQLQKEMIESARLKYQTASAREEEAKKKFERQKIEYKALREKAVVTCKESSSEDCLRAVFDTNLKAKDSILNAADAMIEMLAKAGSMIESSEYLTTAEAEQETARLSAKAESISALKRGITTSFSPSQTSQFLGKLKEEIIDAKKLMKVSNERLNAKALQSVIRRTSELEAKLNLIIDPSQAGKVRSSLKPMINAMSEQLILSKNAYDDAIAALDASDAEKGASKIQAAKEALSKAHSQVKVIYRELKKAGLEKELTNDILFSKA